MKAAPLLPSVVVWLPSSRKTWGALVVRHQDLARCLRQVVRQQPVAGNSIVFTHCHSRSESHACFPPGPIWQFGQALQKRHLLSMKRDLVGDIIDLRRTAIPFRCIDRSGAGVGQQTIVQPGRYRLSVVVTHIALANCSLFSRSILPNLSLPMIPAAPARPLEICAICQQDACAG